MTRARWWIVGGAVGAVLILVLGWFFLISPTRNQAAQLVVQAQDLDQQNALLRSRIAQLQQQAAELPQKQAELDKLVVEVPPTPALPELVRQLSAVADQTGVDLVSLTPSPPVPLAAAASAAATTAAPAPTDSAATTAPAPPTTTMQEIGLQVTATGSFANLQLFVARLETLPRLLLTTAFTIAREGAGEGGNPLNLNLTGKVFTLPGLPTVLPTPTPTAAGSSPVPTPATTSSGSPLPSGT